MFILAQSEEAIKCLSHELLSEFVISHVKGNYYLYPIFSHLYCHRSSIPTNVSTLYTHVNVAIYYYMYIPNISEVSMVLVYMKYENKIIYLCTNHYVFKSIVLSMSDVISQCTYYNILHITPHASIILVHTANFSIYYNNFIYYHLSTCYPSLKYKMQLTIYQIIPQIRAKIPLGKSPVWKDSTLLPSTNHVG